MRADRLISMMLMLSNRDRMTAAELADALEVSERTIYRDIEALSMAGVPVYTQSGPSGGLFLDEHYRVSLTNLSQTEMQTLFIAGAAEPLRDLGLDRKAEDAALKLLAALPTRQRDDAERLRQRVFLDPSGWYPAEEGLPHLPALQRAVWEDHPVTITYLSWDKHSVQTVDPYSLVFKGGSWYLVGRKRGGDYRTYRVARIEDIDVSDEVFERDPNFDIRSYWTEATDNYNRYANKYPATLRLTEEGFGFVQRMIPGRYTLIPDEKGICLQATFGSLNEARGMVLSMAGMAEVLEPDELRQVIREDAQRVLDLYDK